MEENRLNSKIEKEAGGILFKIRNGKVYFLIIHRVKQDDWSLPKGRVKEGEALKECALREIQEETGYYGEVVAEIDSIEYLRKDNDGKSSKKILVKFFLVKPLRREDSLMFKQEVDHCIWVEYNKETLNMITYPIQRNLLEKAFAHINKDDRK